MGAGKLHPGAHFVLEAPERLRLEQNAIEDGPEGSFELIVMTVGDYENEVIQTVGSWNAH